MNKKVGNSVLKILVASHYKQSSTKSRLAPAGEIVRFGPHFDGTRRRRLVGIESGRCVTSFEVSERVMSKQEYQQLIGNEEEATALLRAADYFDAGDILTRRGMIFERFARSFKPGKTFDLDFSGMVSKYGHL